MAATSFCTAHFSWIAEQPVNTIRYSFTDLNSESEKESYFQRLTGDGNSPILQLTRENDNAECCVQISCCDPGTAQVNGISILSESRTLEISNNLEGYIATVRGQKSHINDDAGEEDHQSQSPFYRCSYVFSSPQTNFQVKFMSLGNRSMFHVQSIAINIQQQFGFHPKRASNTFDMDKLKSDIEGMGDTVSEKALDFLKTMELYDQNKSKTIGNWLDHVDQDNTCMTSLCPTSQPFSNESVPSNNMLSQGLSSIMESVLGEDTVLSLAKKRPKNGSQGNGHIFSMLQAVCGEVTKMRKPVSEDVTEETKPQSLQLPDSSSGETDNGRTKDMVLNQVNAEFLVQVDRRLEDAKTEMRMEIKSAKEEVMSKLHEIKQEMDRKLNLILHLLQDGQNKENFEETVSESVTETISESVTDNMDR